MSVLRIAPEQRYRVELEVNGRRRAADATPRMLLSDFLRHGIGCLGVHVGCEHGVCGACTVLVDGTPQRSCTQLAVQAEGRSITTVEGLSGGEGLNRLQQAFRDCHALQCGFCTPGILLSASALLRDNPAPDTASIRDMLTGHMCRCTGYASIVRAIGQAAGNEEED